jgi:hypothetical protein
VDKKEDIRLQQNHYGSVEWIYLPQRAAEMLRDLQNGVVALAEAAYERGRSEGQHFINRLAEGSVTIEDLNRAINPTD